MIEEHPIALQLRYLQTLLELGSSASTTIVFPAPIDLFEPFLEQLRAAERPTCGARPALGPARRGRAGPVAAAGRRARRARAADATEELEQCPFCEGREDRTPPEMLALPRRPRPDTPLAGARRAEPLSGVRAPGGRRPLAAARALDRRARRRRARSWSPRPGAAGARRRARAATCTSSLVNEGREAGASLQHSHSQLVWLRGAAGRGSGAPRRAAGSATTATRADEGTRVVERARRARAAVPVREPLALRMPRSRRSSTSRTASPASCSEPRSRWPATPCAASTRSTAAAARTSGCTRPGTGTSSSLPRLTVFAGRRARRGLYVNTLAPEDAAQALRG